MACHPVVLAGLSACSSSKIRSGSAADDSPLFLLRLPSSPLAVNLQTKKFTDHKALGDVLCPNEDEARPSCLTYSSASRPSAHLLPSSLPFP
jgi:hypothetical protein